MPLSCYKKIIVASVITCGLSAIVVFYSVLYKSYHQWEYRGNFTEDSSLIFVSVIFRHGDRSPMFNYKTNPHANAFPEGIGELTKKGKQHMYQKGQFFRRMYNGYINNLYLDSEILTKSTQMTRTIMSAQMVLAGMYPPRNYQKWSNLETVWQPIPIYSNSPDYGSLLAERGRCPSFDYFVEKLYLKVLNLTEDENITAPLFAYLSEKCEQPINIKNLNNFYDLLVCQISAGLKLPEWINSNHFQTIESLVMNKEKIKLVIGNLQFQQFIIGPLLREIGKNMELCLTNSNHNSTRKIHLYSGHDITLAAAMGFLGEIIKMPGFGASLHFHLYFDNTIGYSVKVFYFDQWNNEMGKEITIPTCGNPCKIQQFIRLLTDNFPEGQNDCQQVGH